MVLSHPTTSKLEGYRYISFRAMGSKAEVSKTWLSSPFTYTQLAAPARAYQAAEAAEGTCNGHIYSKWQNPTC